MGGFGSGRLGWKPKAEDYRRLDVNRFHREGVLEPGRAGGWQWSWDDERVASIDYRMETDGLRLIYRCRSHGEDWERVNYVTPIRYVPCTLGGERPYFVCQGIRSGRYCGRIVAKLYGGRYFLCRHCHGLAYASQSETAHDRLLRKANKKRMALGGEPGTGTWPPTRPKGMWSKTFQRKVEEIRDAEEQADARLAAWAARRFGGISLEEALR